MASGERDVEMEDVDEFDTRGETSSPKRERRLQPTPRATRRRSTLVAWRRK